MVFPIVLLNSLKLNLIIKKQGAGRQEVVSRSNTTNKNQHQKIVITVPGTIGDRN